MNQINTWGMTGNPETFRQGARNARDWAKEQRDEAIKCANERANDIYGGQPTTVSTDSTLLSSFTGEVAALVSATSLSGAGESQSRRSLATRNEVSSTSEAAHQESETSMDESALDVNPPAKRPSSKCMVGDRDKKDKCNLAPRPIKNRANLISASPYKLYERSE